MHIEEKMLDAFTLTDVLIALIIIGIISALTIPTVIKNYQKRQFLIKLKDTYSILQNAKLRAEADYGPMKNWEIDPSSWFDIYVKPYLKLHEYRKNHAIYYTNGAEKAWQGNPFHNGMHYILPNGVEILPNGGERTCKTRFLYIDLNGDKKPNMYGKDIHVFTYFFDPTYVHCAKYKGKIIPGGDYMNISKEYCLTTNEGSYTYGIRACTFNIFKNNWQYPDWFPW